MSFLLSTASLYVSSMYRLSNHPLPTGGKLKTEEGKASLAPVNSKLALLSFFASVLRLESTTNDAPLLNSMRFCSLFRSRSMTCRTSVSRPRSFLALLQINRVSCGSHARVRSHQKLAKPHMGESPRSSPFLS